jgi:hypothetical protein
MSQLLQNLTKIAGSVAAVAVTTTIFPLSASAVTTTFSDSATFLSNTSATYLENFDSLSDGPPGNNPQGFSDNVFSYTVGSTDQLWSGSGNTVSQFLGAAGNSSNLTIDFTSGNVTAVGGNFFITDLSDNLAAGSITLTLSDGSFINLTSPTATPTPFGGFTTDGALITSLTITGGDPAIDNWVALDNLYVGTSSSAPTAVPEPFTILGTIFGAGYGVVLKRKLTKSQQDKTDIT